MQAHWTREVTWLKVVSTPLNLPDLGQVNFSAFQFPEL